VILLSCRHDFDSNSRFADQIEIRDYPDLSDLESFRVLTQADLLDAVRGQHVAILVHGFRNPFKNVAPAYGKLEKELTANGMMGPAGYGIVLGFLWPGFQTPLGFFAAVPYANRSAGYFRMVFEAIAGTARTIDVQAHSLGARVTLQAAAFKDELWIDNLMMIAPAVDNECLEPKKEFNDALDSCRRCFVYHSGKDRVLKIGYRIGQFDRALGLSGPEKPEVIKKECKQVFVIDCTAVVSEHSGYRDAKEYIAHWKRILAEAPLKQFEKLKKAP
jgi:esterase/lipase superfamily enzyme